MQQETVTLLVAGLGIGGTLGGIVVGHVLTRSWQRKQWILDSRKEEFRELLAATAKSMDAHIRFWHPEQSHDEPGQLIEAVAESFRVFHDRVFIVDEIQQLELEEIWVKATARFKESLDPFALFTAHARIAEAVSKAVRKDP
jgi:hypothetical protein